MKDKLGVETPTQLVDDIINVVINHLPAVSNFRFKCVSKQWFFLNTEALKRKSKRHTMSGIFYETEKLKVEYVTTQKGQNKDSCIDGTLSFLPKITDMTIYDSCGGLLLCGGWERYDHYSPYVCNPATRKWVKIPYSCGKYIAVASLDFKPLVSGHFNVMMFKLDNSEESFEVFSLETGESKVIGQMKIHPGPAIFFKRLVFGLNWKCTRVRVIDMEGNLCRKFDLPGLSDRFYPIALGQSGRYLHYCCTSESEVYIWKLADYESGSWLLKKSFQITSPGNACVFIKFHPCEDDVVFVGIGDRWHSYNMQTSQMVEICSNVVGMCSIFPYSPCYSDGFGKWMGE